MKQFTTILIVSAFLAACNTAGKAVDGEYVTGEIPDRKSFEKYTLKEVQMDSAFNAYDKIGFGVPKDFRNNRARIFMDGYHNDEKQSANDEYPEGLPTPCDCFLHNDTLTVRMGIGFFGGTGFLIDLCGARYSSSFFVYTNDEKPYKSNLNDTCFYEYAIAKSKRQKLILNQRPEYRPGQQLTGFLDIESKPYYIDSGNNMPDSSYVAGKIYFTCRTRMKTIFD